MPSGKNAWLTFLTFDLNCDFACAECALYIVSGTPHVFTDYFSFFLLFLVALPPSGFEQDEGFSGSLNFTFAEVSGMAEGVNITIAFADDLACRYFLLSLLHFQCLHHE